MAKPSFASIRLVMKEKPNNRKDIRLKGYDYSTPGGYFVTVCTTNRMQSLGRISESTIELSRLGKLVESVWLELPTLFSYCTLMEYVVMPNHLHGIVVLQLKTESVNPGINSGTTPNSLGSLIQAFKSRVTRLARKLRIWSGAIWQRGCYDHVIRNDGDLESIQEYIVNNPLQWMFDRNNPQASVETNPGFTPSIDREQPWAKQGLTPTND